MIPTFRPPRTTPLPPSLKPVPEVSIRLGTRAIKRHFGHFPYTYEASIGSVRLRDVEYYARYQFAYLFMGAVYMRIALADSIAPGTSLSNLVNALRAVGLRVYIAYLSARRVDIYTVGGQSLSEAMVAMIRNTLRANFPTDVEINAVYYLQGENSMFWDHFNWDDGSVWTGSPVRIYP